MSNQQITLLKVIDLRKKAKELGLKGYYKLKKKDLIILINKNIKKSPKKIKHKVLYENIMDIVQSYAKEDDIIVDRRKLIKLSGKNLKEHMKNKRDFNKEIRENNTKILIHERKNQNPTQENNMELHKLFKKGYKIEDDRNKWERQKKAYGALLKTRKELQKASVKELKEWIKIMKIKENVTKAKKSKLLRIVNTALDELNM